LFKFEYKDIIKNECSFFFNKSLIFGIFKKEAFTASL
jgi:hypothetical protein